MNWNFKRNVDRGKSKILKTEKKITRKLLKMWKFLKNSKIEKIWIFSSFDLKTGAFIFWSSNFKRLSEFLTPKNLDKILKYAPNHHLFESIIRSGTMVRASSLLLSKCLRFPLFLNTPPFLAPKTWYFSCISDTSVRILLKITGNALIFCIKLWKNGHFQ